MMSTSWCSIIVLTIITFKSATCDNCRSWTTDVPDEAVYHCYENSRNICSRQSITNIDIKEYQENGTVDVEFDYEPNCIYRLELNRWPPINESLPESEEEEEEEEEAVFHSRYTYSGIFDSRYQNCTKRGTITLKYVDKASYDVILEKTGHDLYFKTKLKNQYFNLSDVGKLKFSQLKRESEGELQPTDGGMYFDVKHPLLKHHPNLKFNIKSLDKNNSCEEKPCGYSKLSPSSNNTNNTKEVEYVFCEANEESATDVGIDCKVEQVDYLICIFKGLVNGNYSIQYWFKNTIQCNNEKPSFFEECTDRGPINVVRP